jgi:hypothetical protein
MSFLFFIPASLRFVVCASLLRLCIHLLFHAQLGGLGEWAVGMTWETNEKFKTMPSYEWV